MSQQTYIIDSPLGLIELQIEQNCLHKLSLVDTQQPGTSSPVTAEANQIIEEIRAYFSNPHHHWAIPLKLNVTPFRQRVLQALQKIPVGTTLTYGELARQLKTSARAIGQACRTNPIPVVIPCHRIVAAGHIGGYSGETGGQMISIKEWLLAHESPHPRPLSQNKKHFGRRELLCPHPAPPPLVKNTPGEGNHLALLHTCN